jgi:flavin-binding protein dodecin
MYPIVELVGKDPICWEYAVRNTIEAASESLRDLRIAKVKELDVKIVNGKVSEYRVKIDLSFKDEKW